MSLMAHDHETQLRRRQLTSIHQESASSPIEERHDLYTSKAKNMVPNLTDVSYQAAGGGGLLDELNVETNLCHLSDSSSAYVSADDVPTPKVTNDEQEADYGSSTSFDQRSVSSASPLAGNRMEQRERFVKSDRSTIVNLIYETRDKVAVDNTGVNWIDNDSDSDNFDEVKFSKTINDNRPLLQTDVRESVQMEKVGLFGSRRNRMDSGSESEEEAEPMLSLVIQLFVPFLIAGFGTVAAGLVLDNVQHWDVFQNVSEVFILVPALLGLKGNLEMTLASRLSTQANLGNMNTFAKQWNLATGNIALIQCQATVVGFLAAIFAILMDWLPEGDFNMKHALLLCAASLLTASVASFLLGVLMVCVVVTSHKCKINPDNVATPIAASLGDLTTLALLAHISNVLYYIINDSSWLCVAIIVVFLSLIPVWCLIANQNIYTSDVLYTGWTPVISAMAISSLGGCILDVAVSSFKGIAVFQPVINGVGGNLVAVQASRISTYLHRSGSGLGRLPKSDTKTCQSPCYAFFSRNVHSRTARVLLMMVVPGHVIFTYSIRLLQAGHTSITPLFLVVYLSAALFQVILLLYIAHAMVLWMWTKSIDPDNSAIPYLTALGDLLGTALLAIAFFFLYSIGDKDPDVGD